MPKLETMITLDAFKLYLAMGGMNSEFIGKFKKQFGKSQSTAYDWERDLDWKVRAKEPIDEAVEELKEEEKLNAKEIIIGFLDLAQVSMAGIDTKIGYIDAIYGTAFERIPTEKKPEPENAIVVTSIEDMERLVNMKVKLINAQQAWVKTVLLLAGEPDSRPDVNLSVSQAIMEGSYYKKS